MKEITMQKIIFTTLLTSTILSSSAQKAFDEYLLPKNFESFSTFIPKGLPTNSATSTVTIKPSTVINKVRQSLFGQNAVAYQRDMVTTAIREQNWKSGGFSMLRYPGGNWSNQFFWDGNIPSTIKVENVMNGDVKKLLSGSSTWMLGTSEFPEFLKFMEADGIVCVNVGYAFYGTSANPVETAAQYAANWVKYYNKDLNAKVKYWELGNENYGPWQAGFDLGSPQKYGEACKIFAQKMKAVDPSIKIGVNLYEGDGGFNKPQGKNWNELVLPIVQDIMDFAIIHHYPHPNTNMNAILEKDIYDAVDEVAKTVATMRRQTTTYTNKAAGFYPIAITEYNARTGVREISRTNALFTTLMLGEYSKYNDYAAAMQWDLINGYESGLGTHGAVADGDPFMTNGDPYPALIAHHYMQRYYGDKLVASTSSDPDIVVYPTTFTSGEMGIVLVNKGGSLKNVQINLGNNFLKDDRIYWHTINGDASDFDRTLYINDQGPSTTFNVGQTYTNGTKSAVATAFEANGVGGPENYTSIKPYSALLSNTGSMKFNAKAYSANYIVVKKNITTDIEAELVEKDQLAVYPNPSNDGVFSLSKTAEWKVTSLLGEELKSGSGNRINISEYPKGVYLINVNSKVIRVIVK